MNLLQANDNDWVPPEWLKPDVDRLLLLAIGGALHTRVGRLTDIGWFRYCSEPATPATDDQCEVIGILLQRGLLAHSDRVRLVDAETGEEFDADRIEITPAGRDLFDRLNSSQGR